MLPIKLNTSEPTNHCCEYLIAMSSKCANNPLTRPSALSTQQGLTAYSQVRVNSLLLLLQPFLGETHPSERIELLQTTLQLASVEKAKANPKRREVLGMIKQQIEYCIAKPSDTDKRISETVSKKFASRLEPRTVQKSKQQARKKQKEKVEQARTGETSVEAQKDAGKQDDKQTQQKSKVDAKKWVLEHEFMVSEVHDVEDEDEGTGLDEEDELFRQACQGVNRSIILLLKNITNQG